MVLALQHRFADLYLSTDADQQRLDRYWFEIQKKYSASNRHYHTLSHLFEMLTELDAVSHDMQRYDLVQWAVFYHDIVYESTSQHNERKSAELAVDRLQRIPFSEADLQTIYAHILTTKTHEKQVNTDANYLLDADLAILGKPAPIYELYSKQIRKEYRLIPDFMYRAGRKKVLAHFLEMERIYKTDFFVAKYEAQAVQNLRWEHNNL